MQHNILLLETARKLAEQHHFDGAALRQAIPYLAEFAGKRIVLKIGGSVLDDSGSSAPLAQDIGFLKRLDINVIIVHGGARQLDARLRQLGQRTARIDGLRVSDRTALAAAETVFQGIGEAIRADIAACGYRGVILGRDSGVVRARQKSPALGYVGEPVGVDVDLLAGLTADAIPIIPAVTAGQEAGEPGFNVNADEVASAIAAALAAEKLILMTDVDGVQDGEGALIPTLTATAAEALMQAGAIRGGMLPKVRACLAALAAGVNKAHIIRGDADSFINEILTDAGVGTEFVKEG